MHVLALGHRPGAQLIYQPHQAIHARLEQDSTLFRRRLGRVAVNSCCCPPAPEVVEAHRKVGRAIAADEPAAAVVVLGGLVHLHALGRQVQVQRGLELIGVGRDCRFPDRFKSLQQKLVVTGSKAQRPRGQNGLARHQVHKRRVGAVPVDQQNL